MNAWRAGGQYGINPNSTRMIREYNKQLSVNIWRISVQRTTQIDEAHPHVGPTYTIIHRKHSQKFARKNM